MARPPRLVPPLLVPQLDIDGESGGRSAQVQVRDGCFRVGMARISRSRTPGLGAG